MNEDSVAGLVAALNIVEDLITERRLQFEKDMVDERMKELIKLRDRLLGEYEHAVDMMDNYNEADGLLAAIKMVEQQIEEIVEKAGI